MSKHKYTPFKFVKRENESDEDLVKRFKRSYNKSGINREFRKHEMFLKKSLRRKIKDEIAEQRR